MAAAMLLAAGVGAAIANKANPIPGPKADQLQQPADQSAANGPVAIQRPRVATLPMPVPVPERHNLGPLVAQVAANAGVRACAERIDRLSDFIGANADTGAYFFVPPAQADQRLVSFSYEVQPEIAGLSTAYASASFAPNQANGCGALYEAVVYWPKSCSGVASQQFGQFTPARSIQKSVFVLENATPTRVFLMPAGDGCISIKKEVIL